MKREFKFRSYNHVAKRMYYPENPGDVFLWHKGGQVQTIMQYTGLKDKNGKDIYEGDILQTVAPDGTRLSKFGVYWCQDSCCFKKKREDGEKFNIDSLQTRLEVIGNVYENLQPIS